jgi:transcriptional regulator with XRE-family HTH domain
MVVSPSGIEGLRPSTVRKQFGPVNEFIRRFLFVERSQQDLAGKSGVSLSTVKRILRSRTTDD